MRELLLLLTPCGRGGTVGVGGNQRGCGVLYSRLRPWM